MQIFATTFVDMVFNVALSFPAFFLTPNMKFSLTRALLLTTLLTYSVQTAFAGNITGSSESVFPKTPLSTTANNSVFEHIANDLPVKIRYYAGDGLEGRRYGDSVLRIVDKSNTYNNIGVRIGLAILVGAPVFSTFSKEELSGSSEDSVPEPSKMLMLPAIENFLRTHLTKNEGNAAAPTYLHPLDVTPNQWMLVYEELNDQNMLYELRYSVTVHKRPEDASFFTPHKKFVCTVNPVKMSKEEWIADDFAAIKLVGKNYVDECLVKLEKILPDLL